MKQITMPHIENNADLFDFMKEGELRNATNFAQNIFVEVPGQYTGIVSILIEQVNNTQDTMYTYVSEGCHDSCYDYDEFIEWISDIFFGIE